MPEAAAPGSPILDLPEPPLHILGLLTVTDSWSRHRATLMFHRLLAAERATRVVVVAPTGVYRGGEPMSAAATMCSLLALVLVRASIHGQCYPSLLPCQIANFRVLTTP